MKIRKAKKSDFDRYKTLRKNGLNHYQKLSGEKLKISLKQIKEEFKGIFSGKRIMFVADDNGYIKAYIIGTLIKNAYQRITYIDDVFVKVDARKKGIGKLLMNRFFQWSKSKKATRIRLGVRVNNKNAINLYDTLGYKVRHYEMEKVI